MNATSLAGGSNNWAVAATRSASGRPLLANDPHLPPALPPFWYLAHVRTPEFAAAGASIVGFPGIAVGHNGFAAWGFTSGHADNTDLFLQEIGADGRSVRQGSAFVPCEIRTEIIRVKVQRMCARMCSSLRTGPSSGRRWRQPGANCAARDVVGSRCRSRPAPHHARSFDDVCGTASLVILWVDNVAYADSAGTIVGQLVGDLPRRRKGWGTIPLPGWDVDVVWEADRFHSSRAAPRQSATGFVASANNQPPSRTGPFPRRRLDRRYRQAAIVEALGARQDWDVRTMLALQMDQHSLPWRELRDTILAAPAATTEAREAQSMLTAWNGVVSADSAAAAVFELFLTELIQRVVQAKAKRARDWGLGKGVSPLGPHAILSLRRVGHLVRLVRLQPEGWFQRSWGEEIADALTAVVRQLRERHGSDPQRWHW